MRVLVDTQVFIWWIDAMPRLSKPASRIIADPGNLCFVSIASCWEIAIKTSLGKLELSMPVERFLNEEISANRFGVLSAELAHVGRVANLAFHHRDPFDRMIAAQALVEDMPVVSSDRMFDRYGVRRLW